MYVYNHKQIFRLFYIKIMLAAMTPLWYWKTDQQAKHSVSVNQDFKF